MKIPLKKTDQVLLLIMCSLLLQLFVMVTARLGAQTVETSGDLKAEPREIMLVDKHHGVWLRIVRTNSTDKDAKGYDPSYTEMILAKELRATARKMPNGDMEIQFRSEIAKGLP